MTRVQHSAFARSTVSTTCRRKRSVHRAFGYWLLFLYWVTVPAVGSAQEPDRDTRIAGLRRDAVALEHGEGVVRDTALAIALYCEAARLGDGASAFDLGWMYANARGVIRDDDVASSFFRIAAARGITQAEYMVRLLGERSAPLPACMADPVAASVEPISETQVPLPGNIPLRAPKPIVALVQKIAPEYQVPVPLVIAIIEAESNYDPGAVSPKNAQGLMQLVPETARRFRVKDPFDPVQSIRGGVAYLRWLLAYFQGEVSLVAAAYNAGEKSVERYGGIPPFGETQAYVNRIVSRVGSVAQPFDASAAAPSPLVAERHRRIHAK
jgi:soluble lytic murein transglycosylase-like protein